MRTPYTRIPQWFFGLVPELTEPELKVMLVIYRHTLGWNRDFDNLSYSQLQEEAGIGSRNTISKVLKNLERRGLITRQTTRITAQRVQVYPLVPVLPSKLVQLDATKSTPNVPVLVHLSDRKSSPNVPGVVHHGVHTKETNKRKFKETNTIEKLSSEQEESLALMVAGGVDEKIARRLILLAWSRGRQAEYISSILGYVSQLENVINPAGMIVSLIERNNDRIRSSDGQQGPGNGKNGVIDFHQPKYQHGGKYHYLAKADCEICGKESNEL